MSSLGLNEFVARLRRNPVDTFSKIVAQNPSIESALKKGSSDSLGSRLVDAFESGRPLDEVTCKALSLDALASTLYSRVAASEVESPGVEFSAQARQSAAGSMNQAASANARMQGEASTSVYGVRNSVPHGFSTEPGLHGVSNRLKESGV